MSTCIERPAAIELAYTSAVSGQTSNEDRLDSWSREEEEAIDPARVRAELSRIVSSRHFQATRRGKEFLQYVVNEKSKGHGDLLKERLIGAELFGRKADYSTGEDPVVRVQAGDVRRRLERYYADPEVQSDILIEIPLGSYAPVFYLRRDVERKGISAGAVPEPTSSETDSSSSVHERSGDSLQLTPNMETTASSTAKLSGPLEVEPSRHWDGDPMATHSEGDEAFVPERGSRRFSKLAKVGSALLACLALVLLLITLHLRSSAESVLSAFWSPASVPSKPVLLCLPRPMVYRPSDKLFDRYEESHPNAFSTREARQNQILPLEPSDVIRWGDMTPSRNSGPGIGGVVAAVNIAKLLTEQKIRFELRFGEEATYADMRDSPVVLVGAINTYWTTQLTSELNFVFDESRDAPNIHERGGAKRIWKMETSDGQITRDYGLITRQVSGKAGQFLVQVAGLSHFGTEAASEFLANKDGFARGLDTGSVNLKERNLQILVSTDITAGRAGPPHIVAVSSW